jgi:hypothetical protein
MKAHDLSDITPCGSGWAYSRAGLETAADQAALQCPQCVAKSLHESKAFW